MRIFASMVVLSLVGAPAFAHDVGMASLRVLELQPEHYEVVWHLQQAQDRVQPRMPAECHVEVITPNVLWRMHCPGGLASRTITFERGAGKGVDVWASVQWSDGTTTAQVLRRGDPFELPAPRQPLDPGAAMTRYGALGVEHILTGWDHLLFLLLLVLAVPRLGALMAAVTAFTVGHSATLIWAALHGSPVAAAPLEACIAASVLVVAAAAARGTARSLQTPARLAGVTLAFGLLHGLGFASALAEVGLPQDQRLVPLLSFNVGVELGQLAILLPLWPVLIAARQRLPNAVTTATRRVVLYGAGALGWFWMMQRMYEGFT